MRAQLVGAAVLMLPSVAAWYRYMNHRMRQQSTPSASNSKLNTVGRRVPALCLHCAEASEPGDPAGSQCVRL